MSDTTRASAEIDKLSRRLSEERKISMRRRDMHKAAVARAERAEAERDVLLRRLDAAEADGDELSTAGAE